METQQETLKDYLTGLGLKITAKQDYNYDSEGWSENTNHYRVTLSRNGKKMTFWFYQGYGIKEDPTLERVIETLASDRTFAHYSLDDFGDEMGWNSGTTKTYRLLKSLNARYERLIGSDEVLDKIYELVVA